MEYSISRDPIVVSVEFPESDAILDAMVDVVLLLRCYHIVPVGAALLNSFSTFFIMYLFRRRRVVPNSRFSECR